MTDFWTSLSEAVRTQIFAGGAALVLIGGVMALARKVPARIWIIFKRRFIIKVEVTNRSCAFDWLVEWLADHPYSQKSHTLTVVAGDELRQFGGVHSPETKGEDGKRRPPRAVFSPGVGFHLFWYKGRLVWLNRDRKEPPGGASDTIGFVMETINLSTFVWLGGRNALLALVNDAADQATSEEKRIRVRLAVWGSWQTAARIVPRPYESVVLPEGCSDWILGDVNEFFARRKWYQAKGIPFRRGYLLVGPPGNGKTSLVLGLAGKLDMDVFVLNLSAGVMNDNELMSLMLNVPEQSIILLEDVGATGIKREPNSDGTARGVTMSGLLNAIDGAGAGSGRLLFMTDNDRESLDAALIRPGRADVELFLGNADHYQMQQLFLHFYPGQSVKAQALLDRLSEGSVSMAQLQEHFIRFKDDPAGATLHAGDLLVTPTKRIMSLTNHI